MNQALNSDWYDYQLIDTGNHEKLERFGKYILIRPEKTAHWNRSLPYSDWKSTAHAKYIEITAKTGCWEKYQNIPDQWEVSYNLNDKEVKFNLKLRNFKHVGIFPEQKNNWKMIYNYISRSDLQPMKVLNLFAYTGGASLVAKSSGAQVTHIDSLKQIVSWAKENMINSNLDNIRFLVDDSIKFVKKEVNRKNLYNGIILDPPAFGFGNKGEKWIINKDLDTLLFLLNQIIDSRRYFFILNIYSSGLDKFHILDILKFRFPFMKEFRVNELSLKDSFNKLIPSGHVFISDNII